MRLRRRGGGGGGVYRRRSARRVWVALGVAAAILTALILACESEKVHWYANGDRYEMVPVARWGFGRGTWHGANIHTRKPRGGEVIRYGFLERRTNAGR